MRSRFFGPAFMLGALVCAGTFGACADPKGGLMLAVTTDMKAPKDVNAVSVTISTRGEIKHSFIGRVTPEGEVLLPATLAIVEPDDKSAPVRIRVMAFQNNKARVLRDVRTTIPSDGRTALMRIGLNFVDDGSAVGADLPDGLLPAPAPGTGGSATSALHPLDVTTGEFDFMSAFVPPCPDIENQTVIDGTCQDNFVDSATLPDFDGAVLGDSTDKSTCFDAATCLGTATTVPETPASGVLSLDRATCTVQLAGADPTKVNFALVTPTTGQCVRVGECLVPIDHGDGGWTEAGGTATLPSYVCTLIASKGLKLAASTGTCDAKQSGNPICTPAVGEVEPTPLPANDAGADDSPVRIASEDYATSLVIADEGMLYASATRVARVNIARPTPVPAVLGGIAPPGGTHLPWRFSSPRRPTTGPVSVALADGLSEGYVLANFAAEGATIAQNTVTVSLSTVSSAPVSTGFAWGIRGANDEGSVYQSADGDPMAGVVAFNSVRPTDAYSLASNGGETLIVGEMEGSIRLCIMMATASYCGQAAPVASSGDPVDAVALDGADNIFALLTNGLYRAPKSLVDGSPNPGVATLLVPTNGAGLEDGDYHYARAIAPASTCVFFSSKSGLEWSKIDGSEHGVLVPDAGLPILGVAVGRNASSADVTTVYYTTYGTGAAGGGVWRVPMPAACTGAGTSADAGGR